MHCRSIYAHETFCTIETERKRQREKERKRNTIRHFWAALLPWNKNHSFDASSLSLKKSRSLFLSFLYFYAYSDAFSCVVRACVGASAARASKTEKRQQKHLVHKFFFSSVWIRVIDSCQRSIDYVTLCFLLLLYEILRKKCSVDSQVKIPRAKRKKGFFRWKKGFGMFFITLLTGISFFPMVCEGQIMPFRRRFHSIHP